MAAEKDSFAILCQVGGLPWWVTGCKSQGGLVQATFPPCQCKRRSEKDRFGERLRTAEEALMSVIVKVNHLAKHREWNSSFKLFPFSQLRHVPWSHAPGSSSLPAVQAARNSRRMRQVGRRPGRRASARQTPTPRAPSLRPRRSKGAGTSRKRYSAPGLKRRHKRVARRPKPEPPHRESLACERGGRCGT